ncbi:CBS domain containing membrane protein [Rhizobium sp. PDO1-076]|uniref:HPP family protein n=1 Tax=Rhizobium sp. PDO1-076 TaxID=1125979 RepID=UPI00024E23E9|nr:HPP family protein [Rhizobium sp. PDO1-076]EHS51198.1 CBS domain containing membrane protein [Rhizobium sp. PDO1-076]
MAQEHHWLIRLIPEAVTVSYRERARAVAGAFIGILVTGLIGHFFVNGSPGLPALIAPMGASAVLLFAIPSSPLAQPWSIMGGNIVSALLGVTVAKLVADPYLAAALAVGLAIAAMMALRCLHPPSGAIALTAVLGGPLVQGLGYEFVVWPVAGNSLLLLLLALAFNNLTGRRYPHMPKPAVSEHGTSDPPPAERIGFTRADLDAVLRDYDEFLDIDRDDLENIIRRTELRSYQRRSGDTVCAQVMSRDVIAIAPDASLQEALTLLRRHHIKALPVTDDNARVIGIVTQTDLLDKAEWSKGRPVIGFRRRLRLALSGASAPNGTVRDIMTTPVRTVLPQSPVSAAIVTFAEEGLHYLPVINGGNRLVGIISQTDVLVAMLADK